MQIYSDSEGWKKVAHLGDLTINLKVDTTVFDAQLDIAKKYMRYAMNPVDVSIPDVAITPHGMALIDRLRRELYGESYYGMWPMIPLSTAGVSRRHPKLRSTKTFAPWDLKYWFWLDPGKRMRRVYRDVVRAHPVLKEYFGSTPFGPWRRRKSLAERILRTKYGNTD